MTTYSSETPVEIQVDTGTAYGMQPGTYDADLCEVGPGTPMGELLRRYWHPIALSEQATDLPGQVRILGEDLILYGATQVPTGLGPPRGPLLGPHLLHGRAAGPGSLVLIPLPAAPKPD